MLDAIRKYFNILLVYVLSFAQTILGWYMLSPWLFPPTGQMNWTGYIVGMVFHVLICLWVLWIRVGEIEYLFWTILFEIALAPLAFVRTIVSIVAWIARREAPELDFDLPSGKWELVLCYLFHIY